MGRTIEKHGSSEPQEERGDDGKTNDESGAGWGEAGGELTYTYPCRSIAKTSKILQSNSNRREAGQWKGPVNLLPDATNNTICLYLSSLVVRDSSVAIVAQPFYKVLGEGAGLG